jgi:DNA-binding transcriptional regulator YiaG
VKQHFGAQTQSALAAKLGKPVSTVAEWFQRGRVPRAVQLELQIRTDGRLRAKQ